MKDEEFYKKIRTLASTQLSIQQHLQQIEQRQLQKSKIQDYSNSHGVQELYNNKKMTRAALARRNQQTQQELRKDQIYVRLTPKTQQCLKWMLCNRKFPRIECKLSCNQHIEYLVNYLSNKWLSSNKGNNRIVLYPDMGSFMKNNMNAKERQKILKQPLNNFYMFTDIMIGSGIGQNGILNLHYDILEKKKDIVSVMGVTGVNGINMSPNVTNGIKNTILSNSININNSSSSSHHNDVNQNASHKRQSFISNNFNQGKKEGLSIKVVEKIEKQVIGQDINGIIKQINREDNYNVESNKDGCELGLIRRSVSGGAQYSQFADGKNPAQNGDKTRVINIQNKLIQDANIIGSNNSQAQNRNFTNTNRNNYNNSNQHNLLPFTSHYLSNQSNLLNPNRTIYQDEESMFRSIGFFGLQNKGNNSYGFQKKHQFHLLTVNSNSYLDVGLMDQLHAHRLQQQDIKILTSQQRQQQKQQKMDKKLQSIKKILKSNESQNCQNIKVDLGNVQQQKLTTIRNGQQVLQQHQQQSHKLQQLGQQLMTKKQQLSEVEQQQQQQNYLHSRNFSHTNQVKQQQLINNDYKQQKQDTKQLQQQKLNHLRLAINLLEEEGFTQSIVKQPMDNKEIKPTIQVKTVTIKKKLNN